MTAVSDIPSSPVAIVGLGAIKPGAPDAATFWNNLKSGTYSITDVPPERWDPSLYFDDDHSVPDKTYSKIGGWVRDYPWDPIRWKLPVPPKVAERIAPPPLLDAGMYSWARAGVAQLNAANTAAHKRNGLTFMENPPVVNVR